jgi:hypothetical protein
MGENVMKGVVIASRGHISKIGFAGLGGAVGGAVGGAIAGALQSMRKSPVAPGGHAGLIYMAIGPTKLALFAVKQGWFSQSIDKLLVEHSRDDVATLEVATSAIPKINIVLGDGTDYALECGMIFLGKVKKVKAILGK